MGRFDDIMTTIFEVEGGFSDHPDDDGGPTNLGITHKALAKFRGVPSVTREQVKAMGRDEATRIYDALYWSRIKGASLPPPVDFVMMDGAVNHGVDPMSRFLQDAVGAGVDGDIGDKTLEALRAKAATSDAAIDLAIALAEKRKERYLGHEDVEIFIKGWRNRLEKVMAAALKPHGTSWTFANGRAVAAPSDSDLDGVSSLVRPEIEDTDLQRFLAGLGLYKKEIDGEFGPASTEAMNAYLAAKSASLKGDWKTWKISRRKIALGQLVCRAAGIDVGSIDGLFGPRTEDGFLEFNDVKAGLPPDRWRDETDAEPVTGILPASSPWPRESEVPQFYGALGKSCGLVRQKRLQLPWTMRLAWDLGKKLDSFMVHEKVHDSAARAFDKIFRHYGKDGVADLGADLFGGCSACRTKRGGSGWSMHAWAIAIDFDPARNKLKWNHKQARLAKPDAVKFWEIWEAEGWVSLGRAKNFDWMHVQAARLG